MKKIITLGLALVMVISAFALTGCGGDSSYNYDLSKYLKVGKYKGLTYEKQKTTKVTDEEVDAAIEQELQGAATLKDVKDKTVHDGNTVNINYEGKMNGKTFDGGSAQNTPLVIGSGTMIDGFEKGLIGHKVGETVKLNLTFPKDYPNNKKLAGKKATFEVKINSVQESIVPSEKEYVKDSTEYKSVKDYEAAKKKDLQKSYNESAEMAIKSDLWNQIVSSTKVEKYPDKEMTAYQNKMKEQISEYAKQQNMEEAEFIKNYYGIEEKDFEKQLKTAAEQYVKTQMIIHYIADEEKISVSNKDIDSYKEEQLKLFNLTEEQFEAQVGQTFEEYMGGEDEIKNAVLYNKVMDFVKDNAKEKTSKKSDSKTETKKSNNKAANTKKDSSKN